MNLPRPFTLQDVYLDEIAFQYSSVRKGKRQTHVRALEGVFLKQLGFSSEAVDGLGCPGDQMGRGGHA